MYEKDREKGIISEIMGVYKKNKLQNMYDKLVNDKTGNANENARKAIIKYQEQIKGLNATIEENNLIILGIQEDLASTQKKILDMNIVLLIGKNL